jgi:hypothetical protein
MIARWIIAGVISYVGTLWISNFWLNLLASIALWYITLYFLDKFLKV